MCHGSDLESLTDLDDDIIITIFSLLDVSSILALRKTCQRMRVISHLTVVWRHALNTQVIQCGFPYPADAVSSEIPSRTLETIVLRSCRIANFWFRSPVEPRSKTEFRLKTSMGISDIRFLPEDIYEGFGKRKVVTVSKGIWSEVVCWEFDVGTRRLSKLAEWCPKGAIFTGLAVNGKIQSEATIALSLNCNGDQLIQILSVRSDSSGASFNVVKTFNTGYKPAYLEGDIIAFSDDSSETYVSNWRTGDSAILLGSEISTSSRLEYNKCIKIVYAHDSFLVIRARSIDLFPFPTLRPTSEDVHIYRAIASHSFGWVDGVSVYPQHSQPMTDVSQHITPLHVLIRSENDDPWSSDTHTIHLYSLEANPLYASHQLSPSNEVSNTSQPEVELVSSPLESFNTPYIFPPVHKISFPTIRGRLRCTDILCGDQGTTIWIQPRPAHEVNLTTFDVHSSHAQTPYRVPVSSAKETLLGSVFPGILINKNSSSEGMEASGNKVRKLIERDTDSEANWTAIDYDEVQGLVVLGASDGKITIVEL